MAESKGRGRLLRPAEFMALLAYGRRKSETIEYADSSMMALANLLSHPELDNDDPMSAPVAGRDIHRVRQAISRT